MLSAARGAARRGTLGLEAGPLARMQRAQRMALGRRWLSASGSGREEELRVAVEKELSATAVDVVDVSGGCGSAYDVVVESPLFEGKNKVQQARMVYKALESYIPDMHSINVKTKKPKAA